MFLLKEENKKTTLMHIYAEKKKKNLRERLHFEYFVHRSYLRIHAYVNIYDQNKRYTLGYFIKGNDSNFFKNQNKKL